MTLTIASPSTLPTKSFQELKQMETNNNQPQVLSPEAANQQIERLNSNAEFRERLTGGDLFAADQWTALCKAAAGGIEESSDGGIRVVDGELQEQPETANTEAPYITEFAAVLGDTQPIVEQALAESFHKAGMTPQQAQTLRQGHDALYNHLNGAQPTTEQLANLFRAANLSSSQMIEVRNAYQLAQKMQGDAPVRGEVIDNPVEAVRHFPNWDETRRLGLLGRQANGITDEQLSRLEQQIGTVAAVNKMVHLGRIAEAKQQRSAPTKSANTATTSANTNPSREIERLMSDKSFTKKLLAGDLDARDRWSMLQRQAGG
jgi:hypothetical protein